MRQEMDDYADYVPAYNPAFLARVRIARKLPGTPEIVERIVLRVARDRGVGATEIMGRSLIRKIAHARQEAIYRVKQERPTASAGQIGKWFGRDSTSVIHALASYAERAGLPPLTTIDLKSKRERQRIAARERQRIKTGYYERRVA